ncbi:hypothetical protein [Actinoplanes couchii]|nr:hypothetical protein [Actinoplanes couchii]MDR6321353.1 membrane protease YdiL (CAAX protease family) [Actinoplanes couchii]
MTTSTPYHRLARTGKHRWWHPLTGTLVILLGLPLALAGLFGAASAMVAAFGGPAGFLTSDAGSFLAGGAESELAITLIVLGMLTPVCLFAAGWAQRRPAGTLSSVAGRLRWGLLGRFLLLATVAVALMTSAMIMLPGESSSLTDFDVRFLAVLLLLVPLQAAGEEYLFRGWLLQAFGSWISSPCPASCCRRCCSAWPTAWARRGCWPTRSCSAW